MPDEVVKDGQPAATPGAGDGTKAAPAAEVISRKDYEAAMARVRELEQSERFWFEKAGKASDTKEAPAAPVVPQIEDDPDIAPDKLIDMLTTGGTKALRDAGFLTKRQVAERELALKREMDAKFEDRFAKFEAGVKRTQADSELVAEFPDLKRQDSDFTKSVIEELRGFDPKFAASHDAIRLAARTVKRMNEAAAKSDPARLARIAAQAGGGAAASSAESASEEADDELSPLQRSILEKFNADGGVQVTEEAFKARAKRGVNMSTRAAIAPGAKDQAAVAAARKEKTGWDPSNFDWR